MNARRLPHDRPTPKLTRGDEQPRAACRDDVYPFDQMAEHGDTTSAHALARIEAARVCGGCGLRAVCDFKVVAA